MLLKNQSLNLTLQDAETGAGTENRTLLSTLGRSHINHYTIPAGLPFEAKAKNGAGDGIRTHDLLFTKQLLYQLSYSGASTNNTLASFTLLLILLSFLPLPLFNPA